MNTEEYAGVSLAAELGVTVVPPVAEGVAFGVDARVGALANCRGGLRAWVRTAAEWIISATPDTAVMARSPEPNATDTRRRRLR
ncbi:MAG: hypothetical protein JWM76_823 [Pseudonocardiales bacterium]|nr:hypothetical protein [Pseudonocardiales bacterium]